jgi:hypothetical protein
MKDALNRLREVLSAFGLMPELLAVVGRVATDIDSILHRPAPVPPPPFVCVFAEGTRDDGNRITFGQAKEVTDNGTTSFELKPMLRVRDVRVIVFADLRQVAINGMFNGVDIMTADLGDSPVGYAKEVLPGMALRVQCTRRRPW